MKKIFLLITFFLVYISCKNQNDKLVPYNSFKKEISLIGSKIGPIDYFLKPIQLALVDSFLIVNDEGTDKFLHILDSKTFRPIASFGGRGKGPNEYIFPEISSKSLKGNLLVTNKAKFYSIFVNIDSIINERGYFPKDKLIYPPELLIPNNMLCINDTTLIGSTSSGYCRLFCFYPVMNEFTTLKNDIKFKGSSLMSQSDLGQVLYAINDYNDYKKTIVSAMRHFDRIDIYDPYLQIVKSIQNHTHLNNYTWTPGNEWINDDTFFFYVDLYTTKNFIYGLYCGKDLKTAIPNMGNEIHVFDWDGAPVAKYNLDLGLSNILIPDGDSLVYGFDPLEENQPLILYHLQL